MDFELDLDLDPTRDLGPGDGVEQVFVSCFYGVMKE